jgi:hypothetical protein
MARWAQGTAPLQFGGEASCLQWVSIPRRSTCRQSWKRIGSGRRKLRGRLRWGDGRKGLRPYNSEVKRVVAMGTDPSPFEPRDGL